jgi:hypothetical protein
MTAPGILLIQLGLYAGLYLLLRYGSQDWHRLLLSGRGVRPTGPHGTLTRRDALRAVLVFWAGAAILEIAAVLAFSLAERGPVGTALNSVGSAYGFTLFLLGVLAFIVGAQALWWAIWHGRTNRDA